MKKTTVKPKKVVPYDHIKIEKKWQKYWESKKLFRVKEDQQGSTSLKKFYALIEFPYPSGEGLHVGHIRSNTAMDIIARKRRAEGYNVLYPIGWDAFGLPTENYAIKTGIQPAVVTKKNTDTFRRQLKALGFSFDWSREINTTDPAYYKWTQWIFIQFFKKGLAYKKKMTINWCPVDLIGLANEEVIDGKCERCGNPVEKREKEQWMLAITKYAERLDKDLDTVDFLERIKTQQRNWIGKSEGAELTFKIKAGTNSDKQIKVFTTRPDTLFGVTYVVLAPEHPLVKEFLPTIQNKEEVEAYIAKVKKETDIERTDAGKEKTGVELKGVKAINPANNEEVPVWIADYVLADYGTGAVMAVPAHDERDWEFAKKHGLEIKQVIFPYLPGNYMREGFPIVFRNHVSCILHNPKNDTYACLQWNKELDWKTFIGGGIEDGEDIISAGLREIKEESGYTDVRFSRAIGNCFGSGFAAHKNENRQSFINGFLFELNSDAKESVNPEETKKHTVVWLEKKEVANFINIPSQKYLWGILDMKMKSYPGSGLLHDSGKFSRLSSDDIKKEITTSVGGKWVTTFKLRDWIFSRQRYWGEPIPVVHCELHGIVPVPEKDLPVKLPKVKNYKPTETGESPLASISKWVNTKCPQCKGPARRETDTMPNWAGSSWYYLRYVDPKNKKAFADPKDLKYWTPVDWYNGGMEHTTLHLLYSRFWHKFLFDLGLVPTSEPYQKRTSHGLILAQGGEKMSKSKGNVINPDGIVETVGADSLRLYEMFMGPFDQPIAWDTNNIAGVRRFIERVWKLREKVVEKTDEKVGDFMLVNKLIHKAIKKVSDDIEAMRFNTAISALMITLNELEKFEIIDSEQYGTFIQLLAPFAPHVAEELWASLGNKTAIHTASWPVYDPALAADSESTIMVQINGKVRGSFVAPMNLSKEELEKRARTLPESAKWLEGKEVKKVIVIPNKLVNIVLVDNNLAVR